MKGIRPIEEGNGCMSEQGKTCFSNMPMTALSKAIVLGGMRWRDEVRDAVSSKKRVKFLKFTAIIGVESENGTTKLFFN